jgi:hypothetical protein
MNDQPAEPAVESTTEPTPQQQRLEAAGEAFADLNKTLPAGLPPFQIPDLLEPAAGLDALTRMLIDQGVIDADAFVAAKTDRMAEMVEAFAEQAREMKRQVLGLIIAGQNPRI